MTTTDVRTTTTQARAPRGEQLRARVLAGLPVAERSMILAGIPTAVLEGGDGPPMVLLHGPGESAAMWLRVIPELSATSRVIVPDLPGHGSSDPVDGLTDEQVLAWLDELIARTCPTPPVLVARIIGGAIAARYAARNPDRVARLVLVDTMGLQPFRPDPAFGEALTSFVVDPTGANHDRLWQRCAFDLDRLREEMGGGWDALRAYNIDRARDPTLRDTQRVLFERFALPPIPTDELERIAVPVALIWGRHDLATSVTAAEAARGRFGWPLHVIDDAADDPAVERPVEFLAALRQPGVIA